MKTPSEYLDSLFGFCKQSCDIKVIGLFVDDKGVTKAKTKEMSYLEAKQKDPEFSKMTEFLPPKPLVVLDYDPKKNENKQDFNKRVERVIAKLEKDKLNFTVYDTGSKGKHIHISFEKFLELSDREANDKKFFLYSRYNAEVRGKQKVTIPFALHRKTKKPKIPLTEVNEFKENNWAFEEDFISWKLGVSKNTLITAKEKFESPDLILQILEELNKTHLEDNAVKLNTFIVCCTSYLSPHTLRKSKALKGNSSVGKDNLIKTCFNHFPEEDTLFLTSATQATMEDDIDQYKIIAYSEFNLGKDDKGANVHLRESIKQLSEGGITSLKKDVTTGYKSAKLQRGEQKTVLYGTTGNEDDEELATRFIIGSVEANEEKIKVVNKNTIEWFSGKRQRKQESWIKSGIKLYLKRNEVIIPYLNLLPETFFDNRDPRSMRDVKRFLSCVSAIAWLYQLQRKTDDKGRIISEPVDLLIGMIISSNFFNYTYQGLGDQRLQKCLEVINIHLDSKLPDTSYIFNRREIQEKMKVSLNTVKGCLKGLSNLSIVGYSHKEGNEIFYKRYQKGVNRVLIGVNWEGLLDRFRGFKGVNFSRKILEILKKLESVCNIINNNKKNEKKDSTPQKIDTLKLTPLEENLTEKPEIEEIITEEIKCSCCGDSAKKQNEDSIGKFYCDVCFAQFKGSVGGK